MHQWTEKGATCISGLKKERHASVGLKRSHMHQKTENGATCTSGLKKQQQNKTKTTTKENSNEKERYVCECF